MHVVAQRTGSRMAKQRCKFCVADVADCVRCIGVAVRVKHQVLSRFLLDACPFPQAGHLGHDAVLGIGLAPHVQEHVTGRLVRLVIGQPDAHSQDHIRQRDDARHRFALHRDRFVLRNHPETSLEVDHLPQQTAQFARTTTSHTQGDQEAAKAGVGVTEQTLELVRRRQAASAASCGLLIANNRVQVEQVVTNGPGEDLLRDSKRVANRRRAELPRHLLLDLVQVEAAEFADTNVSADESHAAEQPFAVVAVRPEGSSGLNVVKKQIGQLTEAGDEPIAVGAIPSSLGRSLLFELSTGDLVVAVEVDALVVDGCAKKPLAAWNQGLSLGRRAIAGPPDTCGNMMESLMAAGSPSLCLPARVEAIQGMATGLSS